MYIRPANHIAGLLCAGCLMLQACGPASTPVVPSATPAPPTATPVPATATSPPPTATPAPATPRPSATPSPSPAPRAEVILQLPDCSWTFTDPFEWERRFVRASNAPGIVDVFPFDRNRQVRVIYDPDRLTEAEVVTTFEAVTGFRTGADATPVCP